MGRISDDDIRRVREASDLVSIVGERTVLKQKGRLHWACCPFHSEKTASFKVDSATQLWHCFGCGLGGDVFGFVMRTESLEFGDAVRSLAERAHIEIVEDDSGAPRSQKDRLRAACDRAAEVYHARLLSGSTAKAAEARDYLAKRGFGIEVAKRFKLGYSPGRGELTRELTREEFSAEELIAANLAMRTERGEIRDRFYERIMFPIFDVQGRCVGFGGRILGDGEPKYLNTAETPVFSKGRNLYAIERAKNEIVTSGVAVVVEGYTDVIALHEAGMRNVVATLGTALTRDHMQLLGRFAKRVVYLFDGDEAGQRAADRASEFIDATLTPEAGRSRVDLDVAVLPEGKDPADVVRDEGLERVREAVGEAVPLLRFAIDRRLAAFDLDRPEERQRALAAAASVIAPVKESIIGYDYSNYIADKLFVDLDTVTRAVRAARPIAVAPREQAPDSEVQRLRPARSSPEQRAEAELVAIMVRRPELRDGARSLLADGLLTDESLIHVAQRLVEVGGMSAEDVFALLSADAPEAVEAVSAAVVSADLDADDRETARDLYRKLKELDLQRRINEGRGRLKHSGAQATAAEQDALFRQVSEWTKELELVRRDKAPTPFDVQSDEEA